MGLELEGARIAIQGYGTAGAPVARFLADLGAKIVAVSDSQGAVFNGNGLDLARVNRHKQESSTVLGTPRTERLTNREVFDVDCDVFVPAALEGMLDAEAAVHLRARIIAEAANGPTTPEADEIFRARGTFMIPDIVCNAGGVTVSYFEWVQDREEFFWTLDEINARLRRVMVRAFEEVYRTSMEHGVDMRLAAYMLAVGRVAEATLTRGIYP